MRYDKIMVTNGQIPYPPLIVHLLYLQRFRFRPVYKFELKYKHKYEYNYRHKYKHRFKPKYGNKRQIRVMQSSLLKTKSFWQTEKDQTANRKGSQGLQLRQCDAKILNNSMAKYWISWWLLEIHKFCVSVHIDWKAWMNWILLQDI